MTTVEMIGYTILIGGVVAIAGFGLTAVARGKVGAFAENLKELKASNKAVDSKNIYYESDATESGDVGIITSIDE